MARKVSIEVKQKRRRAAANAKKKRIMAQPGYRAPTRDGFSAFRTQDETGNNKQLTSIEPTTGIHSSQWASLTRPQPKSGYLNLPLELRFVIYSLVIESFNKHDLLIVPHRHKFHFISPGWENADVETSRLFEICRQTYIDAVGSGLLYRFKKFGFESEALMKGFLGGIRPSHREAIQTLSLHLTIKSALLTPSTKEALLSISHITSLKSLTLILCYTTCTKGVQTRYTPRIGKLPWMLTPVLLSQIQDSEELRATTGLKNFKLRVYIKGGYFAKVVNKFGEDRWVMGFGLGMLWVGGWFAVVDNGRDSWFNPNPRDAVKERIEEVEKVLRDVMCDT